MANKPFDYTIINPLERPKSADLNQLQGQAHSDVRILARQLFKPASSSDGKEGFVQDSFKVTPTTGFGIIIRQGIGFQNGTVNTSIGSISGLNDTYPYKPLTIEDRLILFPPGYQCDSGFYRYDLLQVRCLSGDEQLTNQQSTDILNPLAQSFSTQNVKKTMTFDLTNSVVEVVDASGTGTAPIVFKKGEPVPTGGYRVLPLPDAGYLPVAYISITDTAGTLSNTDIDDARTLLYAPVDFESADNTGTLSVSRGGTGRQTLSAGSLLVGAGFGDVDFVSVPAAGNVLYSDGVEWKAQDLDAYLLDHENYYRKNYTSSSQLIVPWSNSASINPSGSWVELTGLTFTNLNLREGLVRISVQPQIGSASNMFSVYGGQTIGDIENAIVSLRLTMTWPDADTSAFYFNSMVYRPALSSLGYTINPHIYTEFAIATAGSYSFKLEAQCAAASADPDFTIWYSDVSLVVAQG